MAAMWAAGPGAVRAEPVGGIISDIRVGVFAHNVPLLGPRRETGVNLNAEIQFVSPQFLRWALMPRPHVGAHVNLWGDTSQFYAGLTWTIPLGERFFMDVFGGGALHTGRLRSTDPDRLSLGSRGLFRVGLEIGWQLGDGHSISVMYDHVSNARLARPNNGLDTAGIRYGIRF